MLAAGCPSERVNSRGSLLHKSVNGKLDASPYMAKRKVPAHESCPVCSEVFLGFHELI